MTRGRKVIVDVELGAGQDMPYRRLMCAILVNAYRDFWRADDLELALDGLFFIDSIDAEIYCRALGIDCDPLEPVSDGIRFQNRKLVTDK